MVFCSFFIRKERVKKRMGEKKDEVWQLCARTDKPEEEYVTVTLPKSSYEAFHCMLD